MAHLGVFDDDIVSLGATEQVSRNEAFSDDVVGYYIVVNSNISSFESQYAPVYRLGVFDAGVTNKGWEQANIFESFDDDLSIFPVANSNISIMESLRPNVVAGAATSYEILQTLQVTGISSSESLASLAAAKTSAVEVIQHLAVGSDSGLVGLFEDDMVDLTAEGDVNQKSDFDIDIPIWFMRGHNFEAASTPIGSSDLPAESLMAGTSAVSQTKDLVFEALQTVQPTSDLPYEVALGLVSADRIVDCEWLQRIAAPVAVAPFIRAYLGIYDSDFSYLGADDAIVGKSALFEEDLVDPTASTSTLGFDADIFDDIYSIDADEIAVDDEMLFVALPLNTFGIPFDSLVGLAVTADKNLEATQLIESSTVASLTEIQRGDQGPDAVGPVVNLPTGVSPVDHVFNPSVGNSIPHGGSGNRGVTHRRRRRGQ